MTAEEILIKHLDNRKCREHVYTDDDVYLACLDAIEEALRIHDVVGRSGQLATYLQDVIGKKYSIYFEQQDIDGLIEAANCLQRKNRSRFNGFC